MGFKVHQDVLRIPSSKRVSGRGEGRGVWRCEAVVAGGLPWFPPVDMSPRATADIPSS